MPPRPLDAVTYAPGVTDADLRLLGPVAGRRILVLGARDPGPAARFSAEGAHVLLVEPDPTRRRAAEAAIDGAAVEWHETDYAELAFVRADTVDLAFSTGALDEVADLPRVLRQVHRVLRPGATLLLAYDHPLAGYTTDRTLARPWGDETPTRVEREGAEVTVHLRGIGTVLVALVRAGFRVDALVEPRPEGLVPAAIVWRARKEGA